MSTSPLEHLQPIPNANLDGFSRDFSQTVYTDTNANAFRAATGPGDSSTAKQHLTDMTISDDHGAGPSKGFWSKLGDSISNAITTAAYAEAGMVPPESTPGGNSATGLGDKVPVKTPSDAGQPAKPAGLQDGPVGACSVGEQAGGAHGANPTRPDSQSVAGGSHMEAPDEHLMKGDTGRKAPTDDTGRGNTPANPTEKAPNPLQQGIDDYLHKRPQDIEPGINPRLGCVLMVSHAMHAVDKTFPETNNTAEFRKALKEHGYEAVTVKPGDPALAKAAPGDILVGSRPDGMPSHAAINMGDGTVFNNNSDAGRAQIDSLNQFNQSMHDSKGHWNQNGYESVTIYRKAPTFGSGMTPGAPASA